MSTRERMPEPSRNPDQDRVFAQDHLDNLDLRNAPESIQLGVRKVLSILAKGGNYRIVEEQPVISPNEAAKILNISRTFLIKLMDEGEIPFHTLGSSKHRRIYRNDVLAFEMQHRRKARQALNELTELSEEMGLYDE